MEYLYTPESKAITTTQFKNYRGYLVKYRLVLFESEELQELIKINLN